MLSYHTPLSGPASTCCMAPQSHLLRLYCNVARGSHRRSTSGIPATAPGRSAAAVPTIPRGKTEIIGPTQANECHLWVLWNHSGPEFTLTVRYFRNRNLDGSRMEDILNTSFFESFPNFESLRWSCGYFGGHGLGGSHIHTPRKLFGSSLPLLRVEEQSFRPREAVFCYPGFIGERAFQRTFRPSFVREVISTNRLWVRG